MINVINDSATQYEQNAEINNKLVTKYLCFVISLTAIKVYSKF